MLFISRCVQVNISLTVFTKMNGIFINESIIVKIDPLFGRHYDLFVFSNAHAVFKLKFTIISILSLF